MTDALANPASDYLDGRFIAIDGDAIASRDPADPVRVVWHGTPEPTHVREAVAAARAAAPAWGRRSIDERAGLLRRFQTLLRSRSESIAGLITDEMGKTLAESRMEVGAVAAKLDITLDDVCLDRVREDAFVVSDTRRGRRRFKPHGVMAIIGPFNFPLHLPNGHWIPALLLGNTVVFKPSEKTPGVGQSAAELMHEAGLPAGVFNVVQGAGDISESLVSHPDVDGILFTGSWPVGRRILEANLDTPGRIVALEMGGSNPAIVWSDASLKQAVVECARAAFATTGQRCTCTRRIIVHRDIAGPFTAALAQAASSLAIGPGRSEEPVFMGPLVTADAVEAMLGGQQALIDRGARAIVAARRLDRPGHFVSPGVVDLPEFTVENDREVFGPLVALSVVDDLDTAVEQANATRFGLAASIFTQDDDVYERLFEGVRAGCINRNTGTAGASSRLPFGGLGLSGNHRPAGAFSVDFCVYPIANMIESAPDVVVPEGMRWEDRWLEESRV